MAPFGLFSHGQEMFQDFKDEQLVEEYLAKRGRPQHPTELTDINVQDKAELDLENNVSNKSSDISLDQSNHGFFLVNLHWASFSTGLSLVLAVVLLGLFIAGCLLYTSPSPRDRQKYRMPSSA